MPAKGFYYSRDTVISEEFFNQFLEEYPEYKGLIDYQGFKDIILNSNEMAADIIANDPQGYKLPENMGFIAVTRYKSKKKAVNWKSSKEFKRQIFHVNLHSFGFTHHIKWFKAGIAKFSHNYIYKFKPCRDLARLVAKNSKEGKVYYEWNLTDFWSSTKLERMFRKRFKITE